MLQTVEDTKPGARTPAAYTGPARKPRPRRRFLLVLKALLQAALAFGILFAAVKGMNYLVATKPEVAKRPIQEKAYAAETVTAVLADNTPLISVYGEVTAGRQVDLRTLVGGEVVSVHPELKAGGMIGQGEELLAIDRFDYEGALTEAKANLAQAEAQLVEFRGRVELEKANVIRAQEQLEFAAKDLQRAEDLVARGSVTERTVDERKLLVSQRQQVLEQRGNTLDLEEAKVIQQEAVIERLKWRIEEAERNLANTVLKSPFDAIVRSEAAQVGRLVSVNDVVAAVYSRNELEVRFTLSDNQYGRLVAESGTVVDREVEVIWYLGHEPLTFAAVIDRVGADVASTRGGVDVFARISIEAGRTPLRPGAFVEVRIPDQRYAETFRLPETAFYGGGRVFVVEEDRLVQRQVDALAIDEGYIIVRGGLKDGETVLSTRIPEAGDGLLIRDVGRSEDSPAGTVSAAKPAKDAPRPE